MKLAPLLTLAFHSYSSQPCEVIHSKAQAGTSLAFVHCSFSSTRLIKASSVMHVLSIIVRDQQNVFKTVVSTGIFFGFNLRRNH